MKALILAAGYGKRLRPLTDRVPKPLVEVGGTPMLARHLNALERAGVEEVVINTGHLRVQLTRWLAAYRGPLRVHISDEGRTPLETGGAFLAAAQRLGPAPFLALNADIVTDFDFSTLLDECLVDELAHLVMVDNPAYRDAGDFELNGQRVTGRGSRALTFSGIGVYRLALLDGATAGRFSIVPWLERAMARGCVTGRHLQGAWFDTGTADRLARARSWAEKNPI